MEKVELLPTQGYEAGYGPGKLIDPVSISKHWTTLFENHTPHCERFW